MRTVAPGTRLAARNRSASDSGRRAGRASWPLALAGAWAALTAAGLGLAVVTILVVAGWIAAPSAGIGLLGVLRAAAVIWLAGHHVAVQVRGAGRIGMLPLGLVLLPGALLWRSGRSVLRACGGTGPGQAIKVGLAVAVPYSVLAGALAAVSRTGLASASVMQAVPAAFIAALVAAGFGAARALAPLAQLGAHLSARTRSVLVGAAGSLSVLAAVGALATAMTLASHVSQFTAVYALLDPGMVGAGLLFLAQLGYLPNAVLWAIAYMLGPGFAVGAGTAVTPTGSVLGQLPAFPLLAALPSGTHGSGPAWLAGLVLAMPYLAGAVGGLLVVRTAPTTVLEAAPMRGFCSGALTGAVLGVLAAFAGGSLGNGRLAVVGPSAWQVALLATLEVGIAAAVAAGAANWLRSRSPWSSQPWSSQPWSSQPWSSQPWSSQPLAQRDADGGYGNGRQRAGRRRAGQEASPPPSWSGASAGAHGRPAMAPHKADRDATDSHVIYVDIWAVDQDEGAAGSPGESPGLPASARPRRRPAGPPAGPPRRGPSALP